MSKKLGILMTIVCVGLVAFVAWYKFGADKTGPEIRCGNGDLVYHDGMSDSELLDGVTAYDEKDGDVSASLAIESVYPVEDGKIVVVYVAKDNSNNITKVKQEYSYNGNAGMTGDNNGTDAEAEPVVDTNAVGEEVGAEDPQAVDTEGTADNGPEEGTTETSDMDNASADAERIRKEQEEAAEQMPAGAPRIYLTDYVVKVPVGTTVDRLSYVKEIVDDADNVYDLWTKIQITGALDTMTAGTYECTYYVVDSQGNTSNQAVLQFIVE